MISVTGLNGLEPVYIVGLIFFFSSRRRHTRFDCDWSSDVCSSDLARSWKVRTPRKRPKQLMEPTSTTSTGSPCPGSGWTRSEERRVGEEGRSRWSPYHLKKKKNKMEGGRNEKNNTTR